MERGFGYSSCVISGQRTPAHGCDSMADGWGYAQQETYYESRPSHVLQAMDLYPYQTDIPQQPWFCKRQEQPYSFGKFLPHSNHPNSIARRNERERTRVKTINSTFAKLRNHLPSGTKNKKLSKVQILRNAIQYINQLQQILDTQDKELEQSSTPQIKTEKVDPEHEQLEDNQTMTHSMLISSNTSVTSPDTTTSQDSPRSSLSEDRHNHTEDEDLADFSDWL